MAQIEKRKVPAPLKKLLEFDIAITKIFASWADKFIPLRSLKIHYKALEISCHGIPWFVFWICFTWLFNDPSLIQMQVNMLLGLFLDIVLVAMAKAYFRRKRPASNADDALGQLGPDVYSFPSGHASRAVFVVYFFLHLYGVPIIFVLPMLAWVTSICMSRILMNRHYILDVIGGICLGLFEGLLMGLIWVEDDTAKWLMTYLSDEKLEGGEYHV